VPLAGFLPTGTAAGWKHGSPLLPEVARDRFVDVLGGSYIRTSADEDWSLCFRNPVAAMGAFDQGRIERDGIQQAADAGFLFQEELGDLAFRKTDGGVDEKLVGIVAGLAVCVCRWRGRSHRLGRLRRPVQPYDPRRLRPLRGGELRPIFEPQGLHPGKRVIMVADHLVVHGYVVVGLRKNVFETAQPPPLGNPKVRPPHHPPIRRQNFLPSPGKISLFPGVRSFKFKVCSAK
jgi:hypothetical protein